LSTIAENAPHRQETVYVPNIDLEDFEEYSLGGYHPSVIGDLFHDGRYEVIHKLGFGGYSTTWLARDRHLERYVALKIPVASEATKSSEAKILRLLSSSPNSTHRGRQFIPRLLDEFAFEGPNGHHICLVQEAALCSVATSKENSANFMFPTETARSIAAQLIVGLSCLHSRGVCHGGRSSDTIPGARLALTPFRICTCRTCSFTAQTLTTSALTKDTSATLCAKAM
jgi:hypothetical protein